MSIQMMHIKFRIVNIHTIKMFNYLNKILNKISHAKEV